MPHYFSVKRSCLEDTYCEQFNRESVHLVDIKNNPIKEFSETGVTLEDGTPSRTGRDCAGHGICVQQVALPDDQVDVHGRQHPGQGCTSRSASSAAPTSTQRRFTKALEDMEGGFDMVKDKGIKSMLSWVLQPGEPRVLRKEGGVGDGLLRHEELIVGAGQVRHGEAAGVVAVLQDEQQARGGAGEERADAVGQQRLVVLAGDLAAGDDDDGGRQAL
ncbi:hypothetical protein ARSEF1564_008335 [Beauveria bassiana]